MFDSRDFFPPEEISSPEGAETPVKSPILMSPSSSVGSSTSPPDYLFNESIFAELDNSLWIISRPLGSKPVPEEFNMLPKRTSTSAAPAMTQDAIRQLVADSVATALKAQAANMANTDNTNKNTGTSGTPVARKGINDHKRKFEDRGNTTNNNNYPKHNNNNHSNNRNNNNYPKHNNNNHSNNRNNNNYQDNNNKNNHNNDYHQQQNKRQETVRTYPAKKYHGNLPLCTRFTLHHTGVYTVKCRICNKVGHLTRNCKSKGPATGSNLLSVSVTCHACGEKGHYKSLCSKIENSTFHVSKKSLCDESLVIQKKEIWLDDKLNYVEESVEIMDREVKQLRRRCIPIVKVRWNFEFTWEREDQIHAKYLHLFSNIIDHLRRSSKRSFEDLKPREQDTRHTNGNTTRNDPFPPFLLLEAQTQVIEQYTAQNPITSPAILTPSPVVPPSLLFDPRYFFVPEELLPPKKRICSPSSSSTTLSNPSRNQTHNLVSSSSSVYTPTPPQVFEIGKCSDKMYLKHHEKQVEDILNYLDELSFHCIEKMEEGRINRMIIRRDGNKLKTELERICTQIIKLQKKKLGQKDKIAFAHYRISNLEQIIKEIQARHQTNQEDL
ncbi:putative reverse transcriptase domain-containing protein [Tanacetum coccineum]